MTSYSTHRPMLKKHNSCPEKYGKPSPDPFDHLEEPDARSSVETYASTIPSTEDVQATSDYDLPSDRRQCFSTLR